MNIISLIRERWSQLAPNTLARPYHTPSRNSFETFLKENITIQKGSHNEITTLWRFIANERQTVNSKKERKESSRSAGEKGRWRSL